MSHEHGEKHRECYSGTCSDRERGNESPPTFLNILESGEPEVENDGTSQTQDEPDLKEGAEAGDGSVAEAVQERPDETERDSQTYADEGADDKDPHDHLRDLLDEEGSFAPLLLGSAWCSGCCGSSCHDFTLFRRRCSVRFLRGDRR